MNKDKQRLLEYIKRIELHTVTIPYLESERLRDLLYKFIYDIGVCCGDLKNGLGPETEDV